MITLDEYFMGRRERYAADFEACYNDNATELLARVNRLLGYYGDYPGIRSGWRPPVINSAVCGAPGSKHLTGEAIDITDSTRFLSQWCDENLNLLERCELWIEDPHSTPSWVHLQSVAPRSGNRVFKP